MCETNMLLKIEEIRKLEGYAFESVGRVFESRRAHHKIKGLRKLRNPFFVEFARSTFLIGSQNMTLKRKEAP